MSDVRPVWIGTSWKMSKTRTEARAFALALAAAAIGPPIQLFVMPSFTAIADVAEILHETEVLVGAQTMHWAEAGAWTGEVSATQIAECGARLVELGHSERRQHFGETDETVALKVAAAWSKGLRPLVCVGETARERDAGEADAVLERQVEAALSRAVQSDIAPLFAYEPVWAIGERGEAADAGYADARMRRIGDVVLATLGRRVPCLYGGSVDATNCAGLICQPNIDGLFIGRAAWDVRGFVGIVERCRAALEGAPVQAAGGAWA
jgi:triosephosphate isomerase